MLTSIYEWQTTLWEQLLSDIENLPHAMILAGPEGLGKLAFAQTFAARLLCEQQDRATPAGLPCGRCRSCTWLASGNHPDFRLVQPDEEEPQEENTELARPAPALRKPGQGPIRVEQIRALNDFVFVGSHCHGKRIAILAPAETMNPAAANALLKILEEPPAGVYFILVTSSWSQLIPTVRSRCRKIAFGRPERALAEKWLAGEGLKGADEMLQLVGGAPLLAANWAEQGRLETYKKAIEALSDKPDDPVAMAAKWSALLKTEQGFTLVQLVEAVQKWIYDLLLLKAVGELRYHEAWRKKLELLATSMSAGGLMTCYQDMFKIKAVVRHPLNTQLLLEDLATRYLRTIHAGKNYANHEHSST